MKCLACKSDTMIDDFETYFAKLQSGYLIIENVPCKKCSQCGEIIYSGKIIRELEKIVEQMKNNLTEVAVLDFAKVAA